ncbi:putative hydrogenase nickel incorporation protein HypA [Collibacillus ludicampi]|jgi:hydrogenase nickel incorporation protein HypA/HybF|uniref:Hydrogenase maturation factor HypA n=1 Tax=Collibacillus ludicampi TaxID=2771369 RepID=A0AAV4LIN0_9BACL|nr:hydrogenase maturation nickel metallochaperone HypA [Collibacillus ludicampi]GIM47629.1 putative hydrogenase nickel incorporation protein HypA [Collibacillus ludicampi]
MHELSIAHSLVEIAVETAENARMKRVKALYLKLGALSGVVKEALEFSFDVVIQGTPLEGARLVIEDVPVKVFCPDCQEAHKLPEPFPMRCPVCGTRTGQVLEGRELELYSLEGGEGDAADDAKPPNC